MFNFKHSEATKKRLSDIGKTLVGDKNPFYGKKHSDETRERMKLAWKHRAPVSSITRERMSRARKGMKFSDIHRKNISIANKGRILPSPSIETRKKLGLASKKYWTVEKRKEQSLSNLGSNNSNWKDGKTAFSLRLRTCIDYLWWRDRVFHRDGYKCMKCGDNKGGNLHAHHIKFFSDIIKDENIGNFCDILPKSQIWDVKNGLTLCILCHEELHKQLNRLKRGKNR